MLRCAGRVAGLLRVCWSALHERTSPSPRLFATFAAFTAFALHCGGSAPGRSFPPASPPALSPPCCFLGRRIYVDWLTSSAVALFGALSGRFVHFALPYCLCCCVGLRCALHRAHYCLASSVVVSRLHWVRAGALRPRSLMVAPCAFSSLFHCASRLFLSCTQFFIPPASRFPPRLSCDRSVALDCAA